MEMRFPVVEGYAFALRRNLIRCDIDAMEPLRIEPNREPTGTFVRPQVGVQVGGGMSETQSPFGFNQQDRQGLLRICPPPDDLVPGRATHCGRADAGRDGWQ